MLTNKNGMFVEKKFATSDIYNEASKVEIKKIDAFIIGCGTVGGELLKQIARQQSELLKKNIKFRVCAIANQSKCAFDFDGINLTEWPQVLENSNSPFSLSKLKAFITENELQNPVLVDCTGSKEVANSYADFIRAGMHLVTANKIANAQNMESYKEVRQVAFLEGKKFHYETNVGAGLPVIEPLQRLFDSGDRLIQFEGILSGSLSYIFGELHNGLSLSEATLKARDLGYTEPDPREDLNGMDVARKVLIIAREAGYEMDITDIDLEPVLPKDFSKLETTEEFLQRLPGLDAIYQKRVELANANKQVLRYVAKIVGGVCKVSIQAVDEENPLYTVDDGENVLAFYSDYYRPKPLIIKGYGAGPSVTAAGVFSDILRLLK